ncbi:B2 protein-like protein [Tanacetum coccineum]
MENNNQSSFWQFSDQLRVQSNNLSNLSLNDSIWSTSYKRPEKDRRNFDIRVGGDVINTPTQNPLSQNSNFNGFNFDWKIGQTQSQTQIHGQTDFGLNGGFNKGVYSKQSLNFGVNNGNGKYVKNGEEKGFTGGKNGKNNNKKNNNVGNNNEKDKNSVVDKRFKTLPASESLPRNETVGGYIFVCNNDTMQENLKRELFGKFFWSLIW